MTKREKNRATLPEPVDLDIPPRDYQPSKADMEAEYNMPGAKMKDLVAAFFKPITKT